MKPLEKNPKAFYKKGEQWIVDTVIKKNGVQTRLYRALGTNKNEALVRANNEVQKIKGERYEDHRRTSKRQNAATIGQLQDAFLASDTFDTQHEGRRQTISYLNWIIRTGLNKPLDYDAEKIRKLSSTILTRKLAEDFKANAKRTWLPRAPRQHERKRPLKPGDLSGIDKTRVWNRINKYLKDGRLMFSNARIDSEAGCYQGLKLPPDLAGFMEAKGVKAYRGAVDYIPPDDRDIDRVIDALEELKAGTLQDKKGDPLKWKKGSKWHVVNQDGAFIMLVLAFALGGRKKELAQLRWDMLQLVGGVWYFKLSPTDTWEGTKAAEDRYIPIDAQWIQELQAHRQNMHDRWLADCKEIKARHPARVERARKASKPAPKLRLPMDPMENPFMIPGSKTRREDYTHRDCNLIMRFCGWDREQCLHEIRKIWASDLATTPDPETGKTPSVLEIMKVGGWKSWHTAKRYIGSLKKSKIVVNKRLSRLNSKENNRGGIVKSA